jgi:hypothetical protein
MYLAYTYFVRNKITNQFYYGSRGANVRHRVYPENDFWIRYFTSSSVINKLRKEYGNDSFEYKILFQSENYEECYWYEQKLISENFNNPLSINKHYIDRSSGNTMFSMAGKTHSAETVEKISKSRIGNKWAVGNKNCLGRKQTEEEKLKRSIANKGNTPWNKGLPATNKGKSKPKYECQHCHKMVGGLATLNRWHNLNCRSIQL